MKYILSDVTFTGAWELNNNPASPGFIAGIFGQYISAPDGLNSSVLFDTYGNTDVATSRFFFRRSRGTAASPTAIQNGDLLGQIQAAGYGTSLYPSGSSSTVQFRADENFTNSAQGGRIEFRTATNGLTTNSSKLVIKNDGTIQPGTDGTQSLGTALLRFSSIWSVTPAASEDSAVVANTEWVNARQKDIATFCDECQWPAITSYGWVLDVAGGSSAAAVVIAGMNGVYSFTSGATNSNRSGATAPSFKVEVGTGKIRMYARVKSSLLPASGTQQHGVMVGICNANTTTYTDYIVITAAETTAGYILNMGSAAGGTSSSAGSATITTNTQELEFEVNAAGTSVEWWVDGISQGSVAVPTGMLALHPLVRCRRATAGAGASATFYMDKYLLTRVVT